ncbi:MAG TPA: DUF3592 domain-containing protein [Chryseosolibacter sp.]
MWTRQIIFLSLVALTIGLILWRQGRRLYKKWKRSETMVVGNNYIPSELRLFESTDPVADETGTFYAVIEFKNDKGETITKQLDIGTNPPRSVGQRLSVIYNPSNPQEFVTFARTWLKVIPVLLISLGLLGLLLSMADILGLISINSD